MSDFPSFSLWIILSVCFRVSASEVTDITAEPGDDVTLTCQVHNNIPVIAAEWTRPDLGEEYVLFYRDGHLDLHHQHPSFKERVKLKDEQIKDGDVSVILKNVGKDDNGKYECLVVQGKTNRRKRNIEYISTITLTVSEQGHTEEGGDEEGGDREEEKMYGNSTGYIGLFAAVIVIVIIASAFGGYRKFRRFKVDTKKNLPPTKEASEQLVCNIIEKK